MKVKSLFICFIFFGLNSLLFAQKQERYESEDAQEQQDYEKEFTYGVNWNTNGGIIGGMNMKFAWQTKQNQLIYNLIGLEVVHVTHPKERLVAFNNFGGAFTYGKANNMFAIRPHLGREWVIFRKAEEEGIQVSGILAGGPTLAYLKPYYVLYGDTIITAVPVKYRPSPDFDEGNIWGSAGFFRGFGEMTAHLGLHVKGSLNFEYSRIGSSVAGIEAGFMLEAYTEKMLIVSGAENRSFFSSLFINIYFGVR